jgi:phospholipid/cholesterol/gamma-HCH transport system ATP-binding protein
MKNQKHVEHSNPPVVVKGLRKSFGAQSVLNGIDLAVDKGETVAVLGRSGTGKSVLLKLLVGLQPPDAGSICIQGEEITGLERDRLNEIRKKIGFLFQQAALYDSLTIEENVAFPLSRHSKLSAGERRDRVRELLASVGLEEGLQKLPSEISGGMQKRVGLARALALDPEILLFDEPTAGLDPITAGEIDELILKLQRERQISSIVVTHDIQGAKAFSDRMLFMNEGTVVAEGTFEELQDSRESFVAEFLKERC